MSRLEIHIVPALSDNYCYLLRDTAKGTTAIVDPSEASPILAALDKRKWSLDYILNTHHHWDHTGGNEEVKKATGCQVVGSMIDRDRIPGIDIALADGDSFALGEAVANIMVTPGHTKGAICFWFQESQAVFSGDTLFTIGCGRIFEGTYEQMLNSLDKLRQLPGETQLYCGHEYTVKNARFALTIDPDNVELQKRLAEAKELQGRNEPTIPATMAQERATNPFLRPEDVAIRASLKMSDASDVEVFAAIRDLKDKY